MCSAFRRVPTASRLTFRLQLHLQLWREFHCGLTAFPWPFHCLSLCFLCLSLPLLDLSLPLHCLSPQLFKDMGLPLDDDADEDILKHIIQDHLSAPGKNPKRASTPMRAAAQPDDMRAVRSLPFQRWLFPSERDDSLDSPRRVPPLRFAPVQPKR